MSKEITDAMLDQQAEKMARHAKEQLGGGQSRASFVYNEAYYNAFYFATRAALEVEREALVVIEGLMSTLRTVDQGYEAPIVTSILDRLRTRLGITE